MNPIELQRAIRQLRLGGIAANGNGNATHTQGSSNRRRRCNSVQATRKGEKFNIPSETKLDEFTLRTPFVIAANSSAHRGPAEIPAPSRYCWRSRFAGSTWSTRLTGPATAISPVTTVVNPTAARTNGSWAVAS